MRVKLAYGRAGLWIDLPDDVPVTVIESRPQPGLDDALAAIGSALRAPIGSPPLHELVRPGDSVAIVFSDLTRPMPNHLVLPVLLAELANVGVADRQIVLINALGTHRAQTGTELEQMLGPDLVRRFRVVQHDARDPAGLVGVGTNRAGRLVRVNRAYMEASVRILTGFIEPHLFAGFSGGPKAVLPGIAALDAILDNHGPAMIGHPGATWLVTEGNPIWEEMLAVALATRPTFLLNVSLNAQRQVTGVFAGDLEAAYRVGVEQVRQTATWPAEEPFDVVITSNSGYPLDLNLYQAVKGMSVASRLVRPGGAIIVAAECSDGIPVHGDYKRLLWEAQSPQDLLDRVLPAAGGCQDQWEAQIQAQVQAKATVHVYADRLSDEDLLRALVVPCRSIERTAGEMCARRPGATIAVLPDGPQTVPVLPTPRAVQSPPAVAGLPTEPPAGGRGKCL